MWKRLGVFLIGLVFGDDYLFMDFVEVMWFGWVYVVLLIVGINVEEGWLFICFLGMLLINELMVEELLLGMKLVDCECIIVVYLNYFVFLVCI